VLHLRRDRRRALGVDAEVRLTNLIDVAFVLLIIFMITAPILQGGVDVKLPEADAVPVASSEAVVITVTADGRIFLNKTETTLEELPALVRTYARGGELVSLNGDRSASYQHVIRVLARLRGAGITDVALMVEPEA
jgi:biopolymer transport protein ExbD/biopolymer transport protein TolR